MAILPITSRLRGWNTRVMILPPEGSVDRPSEIVGEQPRTIALDRLGRRLGTITPDTMTVVERIPRNLLRL